MFYQNLSLVVLLLSHISGIWTATPRNESFIKSRIKHGQDAYIEDAAFQVSLRGKALEKEKYGSGLICGGTLISKNVVLTACHCFYASMPLIDNHKPEDYVIVMGNSNFNNQDEDTLQFNIKSFVCAKSNTVLDNDIALAFLDGMVPKNHPTARPITLNDGLLEDGTICQVYGWGRDVSNKLSEKLQIANLPLMTLETCQEKSNYGYDLVTGMICAEYLEGGPFVSFGDCGGPLVCGGVQVGINSWSRPAQPMVFTNVVLYRSWILKQIHLHKATKPIFGSA